MARKLFAIVSGIFLGGILVFLGEGFSHTIFPLPEGFDPSSKEQITAYLETAPMAMFFTLVAVHIIAGIGAGVGAKLALKSEPYKNAVIAGIVLMVMSFFNAISIPGHPIWFMIIDVAVWVPSAYLGSKLLR